MEIMILFVILVLGFIIVAPIIALIKSSGLASRVDNLERELLRLMGIIGRLEHRLEITDVEPEQPPHIEPMAPPVHVEQPVAPPPQPTTIRVPFDTRPIPPMPPQIPKPPPQPARTRAELEALIMTWFSRVAAVTLVFGVAYFLKYSFERGWIAPVVRVLIGIGFGSGSLALGAYFFKKESDALAQALIATGISILYLSVYAAFNLYRLPYISQPIAFLMMAVVTVVAVYTAVKCDSFPIALLGLIGGFLTPLLLNRPGGNPSSGIGLFAYIALLDAGLLAVVLRKDKWAVIEPLALAGTWIIYFAWHADYHDPLSVVSITIPAVIVFWALFYIMDVYRVTKSLTTFADLRIGSAMVNTVVFYTALYIDLNQAHPHWMGLATLLVAVTYFLTMLAVMRMHKEDLMVVPRYAVTAVALLVIATAIQYHSFVRVSLWSVEALALVWAGLRWKMKIVWAPALVLFGIALVALLTDDSAFGYAGFMTFHPIWNLRFLAYSVIAATMALAAVRFSRAEEQGNREIGDGLHYIWCFVPLVLFTVEINDCFNKQNVLHPKSVYGMDPGAWRYFVMGAIWMLYTIPITWTGLWRKVEPILNCGLLILVPAAVFIGWNAVQCGRMPGFDMVHIFRLLMIVLSMAVLYAMRCILKPQSGVYSWIPGMVSMLDVGIAAFGFELITLETIDAFAGIPGIGELDPMYLGMFADSARNLTLGVVWAIYSILITWQGFAKKSVPMLVVGFAALAAGLYTIVLQGFLFDPAKNFQVIANYRFAAFMMLIAALYIHRRLMAANWRDYPWIDNVILCYRVLTSLLIFELVSVETWSCFDKSIALVPNQVEHFRNLQQMWLSVTWVAYSFCLMVYGIARRVVAVRFVALSVFAITILKVFLSDLSFLQTLYRIFSFFALGLILLATAYLYRRFRDSILDVDTGVKGKDAEMKRSE